MPKTSPNLSAEALCKHESFQAKFFLEGQFHAPHSSAIIEWANALLDLSADSPSLRILAGLAFERLQDNTNLQRLYAKALQELNLPQENEETCLRKYVLHAIQRLRSGSAKVSEISSILTSCEIHYRFSRTLHYPDVLRDWLLFQDGLNPNNYAEIEEDESESLFWSVIEGIERWAMWKPSRRNVARKI